MRASDLSPLLDDCPVSYYWAGFLLADGTVSGKRIKLHLSAKDSSHVRRFAKFISYRGRRKDKCAVSAMDSKLVPALGRKFGIINNKTYNPPQLEWIKDNDLFLSIFAGFVDGDGNIRKLHNRPDFSLRIKCHSSWINTIQMFADRLSVICSEEIPNAKINSQGYTEISIGNSIVLKKIKRLLMPLELPLLKRKWNQIDLRFISRREQSIKNQNVVWRMLDEGYRQIDIAKKLGLSKTGVCLIAKRREVPSGLV